MLSGRALEAMITISQVRTRGREWSGWAWWFSLFLLAPLGVPAQTCMMGIDVDAATRSAIEGSAQRYFDMAARGDTAGLRQNSMASLAANFSGIETAIQDNQKDLTGAKGTPRPPYVLKQEAAAAPDRSEFDCGVFGARGQTSESAVFVIPKLSQGTYAIAIVDAAGSKRSHTLGLVLKEEATAWKLGGLYIQPAEVAGHDGKWFLNKAREYKAKGRNLDAWLYYLQAHTLLSPVPFMTTMQTDSLYDEAQAAKPADLPSTEHMVEVTTQAPPADPTGHASAALPAVPKSFKIFSMFPLVVGDELALVVKFQAADVSDTGKAFQDNTAVIRAVLARYPDLRDAFTSVVARATDPSGRDYGTMLKIADVK
jgi:hypothetical protein